MRRFLTKSVKFNILFWLCCIVLHSRLAKYVYRKGLSIGLLRTPPLYDLIQDSFPNLQPYRVVPEFLHVIPVFILTFYVFWFRRSNLICLKEFLCKHGILMMMRGIFFSVTLLPDSSQMCQLSNHLGGCFDLIFSGHSTIAFLSTLLLIKHYPVPLFLQNMLHIINIVTFCMIVLCRNHYTIDVLLSVILTYFVWKLE